jgi:hypothetical protein
MWLGGSATGNIARLRFDVGDETARAIAALVAREQPLTGEQSVPVHGDEYAELLGAESPVHEVRRGLTYVFSEGLDYRHGACVVSSDTPDGARLLARLRAQGMPEALVELGFVDAASVFDWISWGRACRSAEGVRWQNIRSILSPCAPNTAKSPARSR